MSLYKTHFYHGLIKKYHSAFGAVFNGIDVVRYKPDTITGEQVEASRQTVPCEYSPKEKWVQRIMSEPDDLTRQPATTVPRIAYEMKDMTYAPERKLGTRNYFAFTNPNTTDTKLRIMQPVPWDFVYEVSVLAKTQEDMLQIVEQIIPFFTPDLTFTLRGIKNPNIEYDIPISLMSVMPSDTYDGRFDDRRIIVWTFQFVLKGYLFGPVREGKIIKEIHVDIMDYDQLKKSPLTRNYLIDIGMVPYLNGNPIETISADDPWTVNTTITLSTDNG